MDPVKHFDLVFGGIFALIGMVGLVAGASSRSVASVANSVSERCIWYGAV